MMACFNSRLLLHESQKRSPTPRVSRSPRYSTTQQLATHHFRATGHSIPYQRPFLAQKRSCRPASQPGLGLPQRSVHDSIHVSIQQPRPPHLPRGLAQRIFSQPPRLSTSRLPLPHGSPRRSAKNALLYVKSPQPGKPRKWPPDTCGMAFEKLILLLLAGVTASRTLRCRSQRPTVLEHHPCRSSPSRA